MTDKEFINYLRRAISAGATLEGIKTEIDLEVADRIDAACRKKAAPLSVCSSLLREARKKANPGFHHPFYCNGGRSIAVTDGAYFIVTASVKSMPKKIVADVKDVPAMAKHVDRMLETAINSPAINHRWIYRSAVESWLADADAVSQGPEWEKYSVILFDVEGIAVNAKQLKRCFDYTGADKLLFGSWSGRNGFLRQVCTEFHGAKFILSPLDKLGFEIVAEKKNLHTLPVTLVAK